MNKQITRASLALFFIGFASILNAAEQPPAYGETERLLYQTLQADSHLRKAQQQKRDLIDQKVELVNKKGGYIGQSGPSDLSVYELEKPFCRVMYKVEKDRGLEINYRNYTLTDLKPKEVLAIMQAHSSRQAISIITCFLDNGTDKAHSILDELLQDETDESICNFLNGASGSCPTCYADKVTVIHMDE